MPDHPNSFAELEEGTALGGLPHGTRIRIRDPHSGREATIVKRDIGAGGSNVGGYTRAIDLWSPVAEKVFHASCSWTGVVEWHRL